MTNIRLQMQALASRIAYYVARYWGEPMVYTARGIDINVYAIPECKRDASMRTTLHTRSQEAARVFVIPRQTDFPPDDGLMCDDTIRDKNGDVYSVRRWSDDSLGAVYTLDEAVFTTTKQVGAVGQ